MKGKWVFPTRSEPDAYLSFTMRASGWSGYITHRVCGGWRIHVCQRTPGCDLWNGHGDIVRVLDTDSADNFLRVIVDLSETDDPPALLKALEHPCNTDFPGDKIRLDNKPGDRVELWSRDT